METRAASACAGALRPCKARFIPWLPIPGRPTMLSLRSRSLPAGPGLFKGLCVVLCRDGPLNQLHAFSAPQACGDHWRGWAARGVPVLPGLLVL